MSSLSRIILAVLSLSLLSCLLCAGEGNLRSLDLAGTWRFNLDPRDEGVTDGWFKERLPERIHLPGTLTAQGFGDKVSMRTKWTGDLQPAWTEDPYYKQFQGDENFRMPFWLQPERLYVGAAWYQRDLDLPAEWVGQRVVLFLERPHWETRVWLDGIEVGRCDRLGTPHEFELGTTLKPGAHQLSIRIDNRMLVNVGPNSHSVSDHTQGNWNGIVGRIELQATPPLHVADARVFATLADGLVRAEVSLGGAAAGRLHASLRYVGPLRIADPEESCNVDFKDGKTLVEFRLGSRARAWDEFAPHLYSLRLQPEGGAAKEVSFGFRDVRKDGARLMLNGHRLFLRGTLECAIFPIEGHPATDIDSWRRIIRICKAHGLNHIRFHSWCPPEAAFVAADEMGFYYQVEASSWANQGAEIGSGLPLDAWMEKESEEIIRRNGNHPSFLLFCYGNEPHGPKHKTWLADFVTRWKARDPRRLYTTGSGWPVLPGSDYHSSPDPRIQEWGAGLNSLINAKPPTTNYDWSGWVAEHADAPTVSHEIGQWCVYPDYKEISHYTGPLKARNFEIFREQAGRNGVLRYAERYLRASGRLQTLCYKADIEAALRTPDFGGFQLLDLHDFPGQGTALVGVLNPMWEEKGYVSADEYRGFCGPVVPLARLERLVYLAGETVHASLQLAHFGPADLTTPVLWELKEGGEVLASGRLAETTGVKAGGLRELGKLAIPLPDRGRAARLELVVHNEEARASNSWNLWVYPNSADKPEPASVLVTETLDAKAESRLAEGGTVLWLPPAMRIRGDPMRGKVEFGFSSIFWNTVWTKGQAPHTLGVLCDPAHPALAGFPTEDHTDYQWWELIHGSTPFILTQFPDLDPVVQVIDDWVTGRKLGLVFEVRVGKGRLLACAVDLRSGLQERPVARQLRASLLSYLSQPGPSNLASARLPELRALVTEANAGK